MDDVSIGCRNIRLTPALWVAEIPPMSTDAEDAEPQRNGLSGWHRRVLAHPIENLESEFGGIRGGEMVFGKENSFSEF